MNKNAILLGVFLLLVFAGCGVPRGQFRIRGEYQHLDQAEFMIYSTDGGLDRVDSLHIRGGEFEYRTDLRRAATFHILYPNNDELVIWAHSGDDVVIDGDAQNLSKVKVSGNEDNRLYTEFRQQFDPTDTIATRRQAAAFIRQHPDSPVSLYLLERHFLRYTESLPRDSVERLYQVLRKAKPRDNEVATMGGRIRQRYLLEPGTTMPDFSLLTTDSVRHTLSEYRGHPLLIYFWAGFVCSSYSMYVEIGDSLRSNTDLRAIGYSLDVDSVLFKSSKPSVTDVPSYCDFQGFQSPLARQLGITQLPMAVLIDEKGKIKAASPDISKILRNGTIGKRSSKGDLRLAPED